MRFQADFTVHEQRSSQRSLSPDEIDEYARIFESHRGSLIKIAQLSGHAFEDIEDAVQNLAIQLFPPGRGIFYFDPDRSFKDWLFGGMRRALSDIASYNNAKCRAAFRTVHSSQLSSNAAAMKKITFDANQSATFDAMNSFVDPRLSEPLEYLFDKEESALVERAIQKLAPPIKDIIDLRRNGMQFSEIGEILGRPATTIQSIVRTAIDNLRLDGEIASYISL